MPRATTIFTKRPLPGVAKTRLGPALSPAQAARLAEAMLLDSAEHLGAAAALGPELAYAEAEDELWFRERVPWIARRTVQRGRGLGERLAHHFDAVLTGRDERTAVGVGSDQPLVPHARLGAAHQALEAGADLVLGPDQGGGYYLVGLRSPCPALFLDVEMSTEGMFAATVALARRRGLRVAELATELDVDTPDDLRRLERAIAADPAAARARAPRTVATLAALLSRTASEDETRRPRR